MSVLLIIFFAPVALAVGWLFARFVVRHVRAFLWATTIIVALLAVLGVWLTIDGIQRENATKAQRRESQRLAQERFAQERSSFWAAVDNLPGLTDHERSALQHWLIDGKQIPLSINEKVEIWRTVTKGVSDGRLNPSNELLNELHEAGY